MLGCCCLGSLLVSREFTQWLDQKRVAAKVGWWGTLTFALLFVLASASSIRFYSQLKDVQEQLTAVQALPQSGGDCGQGTGLKGPQSFAGFFDPNNFRGFMGAKDVEGQREVVKDGTCVLNWKEVTSDELLEEIKSRDLGICTSEHVVSLSLWNTCFLKLRVVHICTICSMDWNHIASGWAMHFNSLW